MNARPSGFAPRVLTREDCQGLVRDSLGSRVPFKEHYLASLTQDLVPMAGGGTGTLCLGGSIGRGVGGVIVNSGATGTTSVVGDLTMQPQPLGNVAVVSCQT